MNIVSASLAAWALATGLHEPPAIEFASPADIAELRYPGARGAGHADVVAVYADETATIYLRDDWNARDPADLSVLVHEFVHHVQNRRHARFACAAQREADAYALQERFLGLFGKSLESEFGVDRFTLTLRTRCLPM
jgi:hypothetical protein